jgi:hypothetical protein
MRAEALASRQASIAIREGWYIEHLSGWGLTRERVEPSLSPKHGTHKLCRQMSDLHRASFCPMRRADALQCLALLTMFVHAPRLKTTPLLDMWRASTE